MEKMEPGNQVCIVANAHLDQRNPMYHVHEKLILVLVVERKTGVILDCDVNVVCNLTRQFIQAIFLGMNLEQDINKIRDSIQENYFGMSAKALVTAARAARSKYLEIPH